MGPGLAPCGVEQEALQGCSCRYGSTAAGLARRLEPFQLHHHDRQDLAENLDGRDFAVELA